MAGGVAYVVALLAPDRRWVNAFTSAIPRVLLIPSVKSPGRPVRLGPNAPSPTFMPVALAVSTAHGPGVQCVADRPVLVSEHRIGAVRLIVDLARAHKRSYSLGADSRLGVVMLCEVDPFEQILLLDVRKDAGHRRTRRY